MKPYIVKQGDYLDKIAHAVGATPDEIWNAPENVQIKKTRAKNLLHPGDVLYVPEQNEVDWLPLKPGTANLFVAEVPRVTLRIALKRDDGTPIANEPYVLEGLGEPIDGTTDGGGGVEINAPVHIREVHLRLPNDDVTYPVYIGDMDPVDEASGARKRLQHLGFRAIDSLDDPESADADALREFQAEHGLPATGNLDDATKSALVDAHGS